MVMCKNDKLTALHAQMVRAVESLVSGEDWDAMLKIASRFHHYSFRNVCLILAQNKDATRVGGYQTWRALGRQVKKGERGIAILAPCLSRSHSDRDETEERTSVLRGFRVVHVFDISQLTDPSPLPEVAPLPLEAGAPAALWDGLADQLRRAGFVLRSGECRPANGLTDFVARTVIVQRDLAPAQAVKTLAHELAHVLLHQASEYQGDCRGRAEVEAESVAHLVCAVAGVETDAYSFPYVARWADGDVALVRESAERVIATARAITAVLDPLPQRTSSSETVRA